MRKLIAVAGMLCSLMAMAALTVGLPNFVFLTAILLFGTANLNNVLIALTIGLVAGVVAFFLNILSPTALLFGGVVFA